MPRNTDGSWRPPDRYASWDEWRRAFVALAHPDGQADADRLCRTCELVRENPQTFCRRWCWELKIEEFGCGHMLPKNWPDALTPGDWKSLAMFAENETANLKPVEA